MKRKIIAYYRDELQDWVAELDCGHGQHVRHKPPFFNRPWTTSKAGRDSMLGSELDCVLCDHLEFPDDMLEYKRTPEFTASTVPPGLLRNHSTKAGIWGRILVLEGKLLYTVRHPVTQTFELSPDKPPGIVVPEMAHHVLPVDQVRFCVAFYRKANTPAG